MVPSATVCYAMLPARFHRWRCNLWVYSSASVVLCDQLFALNVCPLCHDSHENAQAPTLLKITPHRCIAAGGHTHCVPPRTWDTPLTLEKNTGTISRLSLNHEASRDPTGQNMILLLKYSAGRAGRSSGRGALTDDSPPQHHG